MSEHVPGQDDEDGIKCPRCWCPGTHVTHTRKSRRTIRRRRECENPNCMVSFWTVERIQIEDAEKKKPA